MATITTISGLQTVSTTGAVTPTTGAYIGGITGDITLCCEVISMTAGSTARIQFEDSVNGFTAVTPLWEVNIIGQMGQGGTSFTAGSTSAGYNPTTEKFSIRKYALPSNNFGVASAVIRANVLAITAASSLTLNSWFEV